jgi:hypothetical protein
MVIYCDVVTLLGTWHDYEGRRTPARTPRSIARQVGTAASSRPSVVTIFYSPRLSTSHRHKSRHRRESRRVGHPRRDSMNQRSSSDYYTIKVSIRAPFRADWEAKFSNFHVESYQPDYSKVIHEYTSSSEPTARPVSVFSGDWQSNFLSIYLQFLYNTNA